MGCESGEYAGQDLETLNLQKDSLESQIEVLKDTVSKLEQENSFSEVDERRMEFFKNQILAKEVIFDGKDNEFDFVVASHVLEHVQDPVLFLSEIQRVSSIGGYIEVPTKLEDNFVFDINCPKP